MKVIGITGGIGSGKSFISGCLAKKYQLPLIDADAIAREATKCEDVKKQIRSIFGDDYFDSFGELDRSALGMLVFNNEGKRRQLNSIIHPIVRKTFYSHIEEFRSEGNKFAVYDCPLLFEENLQNDVDISVLVYAPKEICITRLFERNGYSRQEAERRIASQMPIDEKKKLADIVFYNNGSIDESINALDALFDEIRRKTAF